MTQSTVETQSIISVLKNSLLCLNQSTYHHKTQTIDKAKNLLGDCIGFESVDVIQHKNKTDTV